MSIINQHIELRHIPPKKGIVATVKGIIYGEDTKDNLIYRLSCLEDVRAHIESEIVITREMILKRERATA